MKKFYLTLAIAATCFFGCEDTENDVLLPASFDYVGFTEQAINLNEGDAESLGRITATFGLSSDQALDQDRTFTYAISFPETGAAVEGVDFTLPASSGSFTLPAGQFTTQVVLLESVINNAVSVGKRSIIFTITSGAEGFILGEPDDRSGVITINIAEDDLFEFAYTSFEEVPTVTNTLFYDKSGFAELNNIAGDPPVDFVATGAELGFDSSFSPTDIGDDGVERMGVTSNVAFANVNDSNIETDFTDGTQGFISSDLDGKLIIEFDEFTGLTPDVTNAVIDLKVYFNATSWESNEGIEVFFQTAEGLGAPIISILSDDVEEISGSWRDIRASIPTEQLTTGRLVVTLKNSSNIEMIMIDRISVKGIL